MRSRLLLPPSWRSRAPPPRQRHRRDRPLPPRAPHAQPPPRERCPTPRPSTTRSSSPPISVTAFSAVASASTPSPRSTSTISSPRTSPPSSTSAVTTPMGSSSPVLSRRSTPGWFCRWRAPHPAGNPRLRRRSPSFAQRLSSPKPPRTPRAPFLRAASARRQAPPCPHPQNKPRSHAASPSSRFSLHAAAVCSSARQSYQAPQEPPRELLWRLWTRSVSPS